GTAINRLDTDADVLRGGLPVLDENVEVPIVVEDARVDELVLQVATTAPLVLLDKCAVREFPLGILVEEFHVRMRGRVVQIVIEVLDVLAVVTFLRYHTEEPLFQMGIALVPERGRKDEDLVPIAEAGYAVLAPAVRLPPGLIVG